MVVNITLLGYICFSQTTVDEVYIVYAHAVNRTKLTFGLSSNRSLWQTAHIYTMKSTLTYPCS